MAVVTRCFQNLANRSRNGIDFTNVVDIIIAQIFLRMYQLNGQQDYHQEQERIRYYGVFHEPFAGEYNCINQAKPAVRILWSYWPAEVRTLD